VRRVCNHAAHSLFLFLHRHLPAPSTRLKSEGAPLFLSPSLGVADLEIGKARKE